MPTCTRINESTGKPETITTCSSCQLVRINGLVCHETGCPEAYKDERRMCKNCGSTFTPTVRQQRMCDDDCYTSYYG